MKKIILSIFIIFSTSVFSQNTAEVAQTENSTRTSSRMRMTESSINNMAASVQNQTKSDLDNEFEGNQSQRKRLDSKLIKLTKNKEELEASIKSGDNSIKQVNKLQEINTQIKEINDKIAKNEEELKLLQERYRKQIGK